MATMIAATVFFVNNIYCMRTNEDNSEMRNSVECPDFAYPLTVIENAEIGVTEAFASGDSIKLVKSLIQIAAASGSISHTKLSEVIQTIDSVAYTQSPTVKSLLYLSEAVIYQSLYNRNRWTYDQRNLPLDTYPDDCEAWSKDLYALKILELSQLALADEKDLFAASSSEYSALFEKNISPWLMFYPTLYDIVAYNLFDLLKDYAEYEAIPFTQGEIKRSIVGEINAFRSRIFKILEETHSKKGNIGALIIAQMSQISPDISEEKKVGELIKLYEKYSELEQCAELIIELGRYVTEYECVKELDYYNMCNDYLQKFSESYATESLEDIISQYMEPVLKIKECNRRFLSDENAEVKVHVRNITKFHIKIYSVDHVCDGDDPSSDEWKRCEKKLVRTKVVVVDKKPPFKYTIDVDLGQLDYGTYSLCLVKDENETPTGYEDYNHFVVTDLETLLLTDYGNVKRLYIMDAHDGSPIEGVEVELLNKGKPRTKIKRPKLISKGVLNETQSSRSVGLEKTDEDMLVTDKDGSVILRNSYNGKYRVVRGDDVLIESAEINYYEHSNAGEDDKIFTDLAIYHPGDTVKFAVLKYSNNGRKYKLEKGRQVKVELLNTNGKSIDKLVLVTDINGRAEGAFKLPDDGLRGHFYLKTNKTYCGIRVEDYKAPGFYVEVDREESYFSLEKSFFVKGVVKTYSGMPLPNAQVNFNIHYSNWRRVSLNAIYAGETVTDANGCFTIELKTDFLKGTRFAHGGYRIIVSATSESGETQHSAPEYFIMEESYNIRVRGSNGMICADQNEVQMSVDVATMQGKSESKDVAYELVRSDNSELLYKGVFISPDFRLPLKNVPSGQYRLKFHLLSDTTVSHDVEVLIYRNKEKRPPIVTPLWVLDKTIVAKRRANECEVTFRSSYKDAKVLCVVSNTYKILSFSWVTVDDYKKTLSVSAPEDNDKVTVRLFTIRDGKFYEEKIEILPASNRDGLEIEMSSFRNKLIPGSTETWTFKLKCADNPLPYTAAFASMTDKSLNAIENYSWKGFAPRIWLKDVVYKRKKVWYPKYGYVGRWFYYASESPLELPNLDFYGRLEYHSKRLTGVVECGVESDGMYLLNRATTESEDMVVCGYKASNANSMPEIEEKKKITESEPDIKYRETECPSAFFYPKLVSDKNGNLEVSFDVPEFNTTWQFQLLGYTDELKTSLLKSDVVANKPLMVQSNLPRFVRTGDKVNFKALVLNNSELPLIVGGRIELFDPTNEKILKTCVVADEEVAVKGQRLVDIDYIVPDTMSFIGFRVYAGSGGYTDGEQSLIAVLPSSSPVVEGLPFYLKADEKEYVTELPERYDNARLTLTFCDNPIWHCITAMPEIITPKDGSLFSLLHALFGNVVSDGLAKEYPQIREALTMIFNSESVGKDSTLISPLHKNLDLKIVDLENTTWLQDAENETLRMHKLNSLLDSVSSKRVILGLVGRIAKLQTSEGGIKWNPGSDGPSLYATGQTLLNLAVLCDMGYLSAHDTIIAKIITNAVNYVDNKIIERERIGKETTISSALGYLYIRSFFDIGNNNPLFAKFKRESLQGVEKSWRQFDIYNKATAAILLHREGRMKEAKNILESLRQYALRTEHEGVYFDNIGSLWNGFDRLIATTQVLEAYHELQPDDNMVDELRQWLLVQRQTQEWKSPRHHVEVIHAILTTGSDWIEDSVPAQVWIGNKQYQPSKRELLTGSFRMDIDAEAGTSLKIVTNGNHPSWGGVITQYIAPMNEVKAASATSLSIEKNLYVVDEIGGVELLKETNDLKVGQRVRVQLTIVSDRDLDYVTVTDERASFMEPVKQTSAYLYEDRVGSYREVRNSNNNIFIDFLPKGTHILTYDCYVSQEGEYSLGIASAQSQYSPVIVAHSSGKVFKVIR